ncbi:MAG: tol-pal system protein YbgF [bacterium]
MSWGNGKSTMYWVGLGLWASFLMYGCATHQEVLDLKPHVNKAVLQVNDLANQIYDLEGRLRRLENRQTPDYIGRLADLETRLNSLQDEVRSHITAEQENANLWKKFDQRFQYLSQELDSERKASLQFQEETRKKFEELTSRSGGLTSHGEESENQEVSESAPLQSPSSGNTALSGNPAPSVDSANTPIGEAGAVTTGRPADTVSAGGTPPVPPPSGTPGPFADITDEKGVYEDAYQAFLQEDWATAQKKFLVFLDRYPKSELADNAQFWIGEIFYSQKNYEKAILEYEKVIQNYPKGDKMPAALLKQAYAFYAIGRVKEATILLKQVIEKVPQSDQAQAAAKKLEAISKEGKSAP